MNRLVTRLPLFELWDDVGPVVATWQRDLTAVTLHELLHFGPVRFVVATLDETLRWVPLAESWAFWKAEVRGRVANPEGAFLDHFPGGYCYFAAEWRVAEEPPIVVLSVHH